MIEVIAVGKKHDSWIQDGLERYEKRLRSPYDIKWVLLAYSHIDGDRARQDESERILSKVSDSDFVVLLDERGKNLSSVELSQLLSNTAAHSKSIKIVIGGAYGVSDNLYARANMVWSLSNLVFPHQLVRLILAEQLYRAQEIHHNRPYHHHQ